MNRRHSGIGGFTLIELLMVMSIIAMLAGLLVPLMDLAKTRAKQSVSLSIMAKLDAGIRAFRSDMRIYPRQTDLGNADTDASRWTNNLGFRLNYSPTADYAARLQADLAAIHTAFYFVNGVTVGTGTPPACDGTHVFRSPDWMGSQFGITNIMMNPGTLKLPDTAFALNGTAGLYVQTVIPGPVQYSQVLSRLADELTSLKFLSGQMPVLAPQGIDPCDPADKALYPSEDARYAILYIQRGASPVMLYNYVPYNKGADARGPVLTAANAQSQGFRGDYLANQLDKRYYDSAGSAILDAYGNPIVYICDVDPPMMSFSSPMAKGGAVPIASRYGMGGRGRSATRLLQSDIRNTAGAAYQYEFELWSAGPDGRFVALRSDAANKDNVPFMPYVRGLQ